MDQGIQLLDLAQSAYQLFMAQPAKEKRKLLNFLLSNCTWQQGILTVAYKEPFDMLAETVAAAARVEAAQGAEMAQKQVWLCRQSAENRSLPQIPVNREFTGKNTGPQVSGWRTRDRFSRFS